MATIRINSYFNSAISGFRSLFDSGAYRPASVHTPAAAASRFNDPESGQKMVMPVVKNTFIDFPCESPPLIDKYWKSSPDRLLCKSFHSKHPKMEASHWQKTCNPCAYHLYKEDGCRMGDACRFCHLCKQGEVKRKKREKARQRKQELRVQAGMAESTVSPLPVGLVNRVAANASGGIMPLMDELGTPPSVTNSASQPEFANDDYNWREFEAIFKQAASSCDDGSVSSTQTTQASLTRPSLSPRLVAATSPASMGSNPYQAWQNGPIADARQAARGLSSTMSRRKLSPSRIRTGAPSMGSYTLQSPMAYNQTR